MEMTKLYNYIIMILADGICVKMRYMAHKKYYIFCNYIGEK